jgi:hypothetical protein
MAAAKPSKRLPLAKATAKPVIADRRIVPSRERLTTPAFSVSVSPSAAKTSGTELATTEEMV